MARANQQVAYVVRVLRESQGMTQTELGHRLGLSKASVSVLEQSAFPGKRVREFTADDLMAISEAFSISPVALALMVFPDSSEDLDDRTR